MLELQDPHDILALVCVLLLLARDLVMDWPNSKFESVFTVNALVLTLVLCWLLSGCAAAWSHGHLNFHQSRILYEPSVHSIRRNILLLLLDQVIRTDLQFSRSTKVGNDCAQISMCMKQMEVRLSQWCLHQVAPRTSTILMSVYQSSIIMFFAHYYDGIMCDSNCDGRSKGWSATSPP